MKAHNHQIIKVNGRTYEHFNPDKYKFDKKFLQIAEEIEYNYR